MNIGDYVRTKNEGIGKIIKIEPFMNDIHIFLDSKKGNITFQSKDGIFKVNNEENIVKSSPNIIDLIEVGDILSFEDGSICRIMEIDNELKPPYYLLKDYGGDTYWERQEYLSDLKSILTKEQFSQMEYKL